jgi:phage repressor protein C with HTH and peptisase S24 domain
MSSDNIAKRIKLLRTQLGLTQQEFAEKIGYRWYQIKDIETEKTKASVEIVARVSEVFSVNANWLLMGRGPMFREEHEKGFIPEEEFVCLPLIEGAVRADANGQILYERPEDVYPFKRSWIERIFGASPERHRALILVQVHGDSMLPTICPGEIAMVDTWQQERVQVQNGKIYLIRMPDGGITLKRVVVSEKNRLVCISDNPIYRPFEFEIEAGKGIVWYVLGRIRWAGREID